MSNDEVSYRKGGDNGYVPSQYIAHEGCQVAYQTEDGAAWKYAKCPVKDGRIPGAKLVTTTANKDHGENEPVEQIADLCIDIDLRFKINEACQSAVGIVDRMMGLGVHQDDIHLWFSASKGVHIRIPAKCFDGALYDYRFNLAVALKAFAKHLDDKVKELGLAESGLDFQMYKKWQMWRVAGVQRKNAL